jgi:hypothetical protein
LIVQPFGHLQGLVGVEGHAFAWQGLEQGQQAGLAFGEELVQGFGEHLAGLARAEGFGPQPVDLAEARHHQQHLLDQGLGHGLVQHRRALQGQGRLEQAHQGAAQSSVTGAIQLGQVAVTGQQRRRAAQFVQVKGEARLQRRQLQFHGFQGCGRLGQSGGQQSRPQGQGTQSAPGLRGWRQGWGQHHGFRTVAANCSQANGPRLGQQSRWKKIHLDWWIDR